MHHIPKVWKIFLIEVPAMPDQKQNDLEQPQHNEKKLDETKQDATNNPPKARPGGQTDSATGDKPGGGGKVQSGKS